MNICQQRARQVRIEAAHALLIQPLCNPFVWPEVWEVGPAVIEKGDDGEDHFSVMINRIDKRPKFRQRKPVSSVR